MCNWQSFRRFSLDTYPTGLYSDGYPLRPDHLCNFVQPQAESFITYIIHYEERAHARRDVLFGILAL